MAVSSTYLFPPTTTGVFYNGTRLNRLYVNGSLAYDDEFTTVSMVADSNGRLGFQHYYSKSHYFDFRVFGNGINWWYNRATRNAGWNHWWYGGFRPGLTYIVSAKILPTDGKNGLLYLGGTTRKMTAIHGWGLHPIYSLYRIFQNITHDIEWLPDHLPTGCKQLYMTFDGCTGDLNQVSKWDVSNIQIFYGTFARSSVRGNIENWDVKSMISGAYMFYNSTFNQNLGNWRPRNATTLKHMMYNTTKNDKCDLRDWCIPKVPSGEKTYFAYGAPWATTRSWSSTYYDRSIRMPKFGLTSC